MLLIPSKHSLLLHLSVICRYQVYNWLCRSFSTLLYFTFWVFCCKVHPSTRTFCLIFQALPLPASSPLLPRSISPLAVLAERVNCFVKEFPVFTFFCVYFLITFFVPPRACTFLPSPLVILVKCLDFFLLFFVEFVFSLIILSIFSSLFCISVASFPVPALSYTLHLSPLLVLAAFLDCFFLRRVFFHLLLFWMFSPHCFVYVDPFLVPALSSSHLY